MKGLGLLMLALTSCLALDLEAVKAEPNLERRSAKALEFADASITAARAAYNRGEIKTAVAALGDVAAGVDASQGALKATGKNPRRDPKHFKRAEMKIREMLRRLKNLETDFSVEDRPALIEVESKLQQIHDELIAAIMGKKK
jgi:hypothetical protein